MNIRKWSDAFEHRVIFRLARLLPLGIGGLATLALVICLLVLVYALLPSIEPKQPDEIPTPAPTSVSGAEIQQYLQKPEESTEGLEPPVADAASAQVTDTEVNPQTPEGIVLATAIGELNQLLIKAGVSFIDITEQQCGGYDYYGECYDWREVTVTEGVSKRYFEVLSIYSQNDTAEAVEYSVPRANFSVNLVVDAGIQTQIDATKELNDILRELKPAQILEYYNAWVDLRTDKEAQQQQEYQTQQLEQEQQYTEKVANHQETIATKQMLKSSSGMGLIIALGLLVFAGLVLAVIAIERHSRAMNQLLIGIRDLSPPPTPDP